MDPLQLTGVVAVSVSAGFFAAAHKYKQQFKALQSGIFSSNMESITRLTKAALDTLLEDYKLDPKEAPEKFFARCAGLGMRLVRIDPKTGESNNVTNPEAPKL